MSDEGDADACLEEDFDVEWYVAMQQLFQERMTFISPGISTPQSLNSTGPYLPLVLYKPLSDISVKLKELSRLNSSQLSTAMHVNSSISSGILTQRGPGGFILVTPPQANMAGSFTRYPEFFRWGNDDVE